MAVEDQAWYKRFTFEEFKGSQNNASFRGVPFIIDTSSFVGGRRIVDHEYPQRDIPYSEDLGRSIRKFDVSGILLGETYLEQRDNLVIACEQEGAAELLHPYYGRMTVKCKSFEITDTRRETRLCRFTISLVETGELIFTQSKDTVEAINTSVTLALEDSRTWFTEAYRAVRKPLVFLEGITATMFDVLDSIDKGKQLANMDAAYFREIETAELQIAAIINSGEDVYDTIESLTTFGILEDYDSTLLKKAFKGLQENSMNVSASTAITSDDTDNITLVTQKVAVITMCSIIGKIEYTSTEEAESYQSIIVDKIDDLIDSITDDQVLQDFRDLRRVIVEHIENRSLTLPQLTTFTGSQALPVIVISNMLYGNVDQEQDIIDRNRIFHPGFAPGGVPLQVLLDA